MLRRILSRKGGCRSIGCGHSRALHFLSFGHCLAFGCKCKGFTS